MKNFKRILAAVLAVMFVVTTAAVSVFAGAASGKWYNEAVEYLDNIGVSDIGTTAGEALDRDEFVTWIAKIESHQLYEDAWTIWEYTANATFSDVSDSDHKGAIGHSVNRGFIIGNGDGTFTPNAQITLAEAAAVVVRVMGYSARVTGEDWAVNSMYVANTYCGAFDETFLTETKTFDPEYKLTKGEGAYILYSIMNGKHHTTCNGTCDCTLNKTFYNIDLGEWFANSKLSTVRYTMVVTNVPMAYTNTTQQFRRYDALLAGASYDSIFADDLYNSNGVVDTTGVVTLTSVDGTYTTQISVADFMKEVVAGAPEGTFYGQTAKDELLAYAGQGKVVRIAVASANKGAATLNADQIKSLAVLANADADTYIGYATLSNETMRKDNSTVGWKYAAANTVDSNSNTYTRMATGLNWTNVVYNANGTVKNAQLVVGDKTYEVVRAYTGAANEIKVFAPAGIFANATKAVVSVVGDLGDTVYAGARFEANQASKLNATDAAYVVGGVATETFTLSENYSDYIAYELDVKANFVTNTTFNLSSDFVVNGRLDLNTIDMTNPLTDAEAMELILAPAQGESTVILSDTDGDGNYDVAVVTESTRALYYGEVNSSVDPAGEGYYGGRQDWTREVYTSFGDYVMAVRGLKGHSIGGLVVDKTVAFGGSTGGGTDGWNITSTKATDKVQLVICFSNERQIYGGNNDTTQYGTSAVYPYTTVDVAELTTAYIKEVSANKAVIGGQQCYVATVVDTNNAVKTVYIPVAPKASITLPVTVDGITSNVTFNAGESLLSFVTDHDTEGNIGASTGTWMAGHTVKYVADENGVAWCMKETATSGAVTGYVAAVAKSTAGDNTYNVTVVANASTSTGTTAHTYATVDDVIAAAKEQLRPFGTQIIYNQYGVNALINDEEITVYQIQAGLDAALAAAGCTNHTVAVNIKHTTGTDYTLSDDYKNLIIGSGLAGTNFVTVGATTDNGDGTSTTALTCVFPNAQNKIFVARSGNAPVTGIYHATNGAPGRRSEIYFRATDYVPNNVYRYFGEGVMISAADYNLYVKGGAFESYFAPVTAKYSELFNEINWFAFPTTASSDSYMSGTSAKTLSVKASATAVWQYDAATYNLVHNVLVKGTLVNNDTFVKDTATGEYVRPIVSAKDLVYLSFASDAGSYYTIEGKHDASYATKVVTGEDWGTVKTSHNGGGNITGLVASSAGSNYRTRGLFAWYYDTTATGAATDGQWSNGYTGDFASEYILTYNKTSTDKVYVDAEKNVLAGAANAAGYYEVYDMIVGLNPYYEKVTKTNALGKTYDSYELMFTEVLSYAGVKGYTWFEIDPTKTILVELLTQDKKQNVIDDGVSYTDRTEYYVDPETKYVYMVYSDELVYTTKAINATPEYDAPTTSVSLGTAVKASTIDVDDTTAGVQGAKDNLTSLSVREQKADEAGFVPGTYYVTLEGKGTFKMGENVKIVVAHPNATTGNMDITVTSPKGIATANDGKGTTVFVTDFQYVGNAEVCTFLSVIGNVNTPVKNDTAVVTSNESLTAGTKLVYLNASVDVIANAEEVGDYWVLRSTGAAIDVTTGEEVGTIQYIFNTYKESTMSDATIALRAGGYFLIDGNNEVQAVVGEGAGVYTNGLADDDDNYAAAKVYAGQIVDVKADGTTTAILNYTGAEDDVKEDVSDLEFVFIYHDADNNNFGIGGKSTNVSVLNTAGIKATYAAYEAIVAEGANQAAHMYTQAMVDAAAEQLAAAKEAAIVNYLNGTFWNVEYSPVYNKFLTEKVSYQNAQPTLNFNYVVIGGTYYVFVNTF